MPEVPLCRFCRKPADTDQVIDRDSVWGYSHLACITQSDVEQAAVKYNNPSG